MTVLDFGAVLAVRWGSDELLGALSAKSLATHSFGRLLWLPVGRGLANLIGLYLLAVNMRLLGLLYFCRKERFGWFHR